MPNVIAESGSRQFHYGELTELMHRPPFWRRLLPNMTDSYARIINEYDEGRTTATGFSVDLLNSLTTHELKEALELLPAEHVECLRDFVETFRPDMRVFRGSLPEPGAVKLARELLAKTVKST